MMMFVMNISSRFVTIKLSKSMESYLKYTFSKQILVFAIAWMGTRDIYVALLITLVFIVCIDYVFNEESIFCCLPESFTNHHIGLMENNELVSDEDIKKAKEILEKASKQEHTATTVGQSIIKPF
jgi:ethanolamine utilization protein EutP (predicted NTPase)